MADIQITREFRATPEHLFEVVTQEAHILNWWGYDGMEFPSYAIDLSRPGPWHFEMVSGQDGTRYKLSGQVTKVEPPRLLGFTWAWHDDEDLRGAETHVTFTIIDLGDGRVRLTIDHRDLANDEMAANHEKGWTSGPLPRLARYIATFDN